MRAKKVLAYAEQTIPAYSVPETHESGSYDIASAYAALGEKIKAITLAEHLIAEAEDYINWAFSLRGSRMKWFAMIASINSGNGINIMNS